MYKFVYSISDKFAALASNSTLIEGKFSFIAVTKSWIDQDSDFGYELTVYKSISV